MRLAYSEAMLFKYGSGTGTDLSPIRSSKEKLSGGGRPSGPMSFLKVYDQVANVVKSGGKTRRAAKMNTLRDWHGDIEDFIDAKQREEKKAWALIEQGYDGSYNGDAYGSVMYQNENLSVRASDEFMQAALEGPTRSAASRVSTPVPQATSSTRSPAWRRAASSRSAASGAPISGTK
jgi:ribonucleoside-diphosphate reductase alpha chain